MKQKNGQRILHTKLRTACLRVVCLVAFIGSLMAPTSTVKAQRLYVASPATWYLNTSGVQDKLFPDYVVEFEIPANATHIDVHIAATGIDGRVLAFSTIDSTRIRNGKRVVKVVTGYSARKCSPFKDPRTWRCLYNGSLYQWACSLRVRYRV
jgi:hypothetical protein